MKITKDELVNMGCDPDHVDDWFDIRKAKKKPLTATALKTMVTEANKAGYTIAEAVHKCASEGWQGFKALYVANNQAEAKEQKQTVRESLRDIHNTNW